VLLLNFICVMCASKRVREMEGAPIVDVDGSYLYRNKLSISGGVDLPVTAPSVPLIGWEPTDPAVPSTHIDNIPKVFHGEAFGSEWKLNFCIKCSLIYIGLLYSYLADCVGNSGRGEAFRSLQHGLTHCSSRSLTKFEINYRHPQFYHVRCEIFASMKQKLYHMYILLECEGAVAKILSATCDCAAGYVSDLAVNSMIIMTCFLSASCTHVSALLHVLVSFTPPGFEHSLNDDETEVEEMVQPVTSYLCHKESNMPISDAKFRRHVYGRKQKYALKPLSDFNPRPEQLRGNSKEQLKIYLDKVRGHGIGVSLLFDERTRCWSSVTNENTANAGGESLAPTLPTKKELQERVAEFKKSLIMPQHKLRKVEQSTRYQSESPLWYSVWKYSILLWECFSSQIHNASRSSSASNHQCKAIHILGYRMR
jgi:hypothetical protein